MRKAKALQIKFTDQKPSEAGMYFFRADRRFKKPKNMVYAEVSREDGALLVYFNAGMTGHLIEHTKGQFSQRIEVAK